ncbi:MAG: GNA1162 family protein [Syntrophaceae bacterium]
MGRFNRIFILLIAFFIIYGCTLKAPYMVNSDYSKNGTKHIAVLPVRNKTDNTKAGQILREMVLNELYFKGYPKMPLNVIDERLSIIYKENINLKIATIPPKTIGELLGVDAVLYVTIEQCSTSFAFMYAPTHVSAFFELRSAKTGETLWSAQHKTIKRNYGISQEQLQMESCQVYEPAMQEVVSTAMKTLPDGPDSVS